MWVIDTASHFKNYMMAALEKSFGFDMSWRFSVANSPWSNGICERMMREVERTLNEGHDPRGEAEHPGLGKVGAGGSVGFEYCTPRIT